MKNWFIVILIVALSISTYLILSKPDYHSDDGSKFRDSLMNEFQVIGARLDIKQKQLDTLKAKLANSRLTVERSEQNLTELLKREKYANKRFKEEIERYSNMQLDSAFKSRYPVPDPVRN